MVVACLAGRSCSFFLEHQIRETALKSHTYCTRQSEARTAMNPARTKAKTAVVTTLPAPLMLAEHHMPKSSVRVASEGEGNRQKHLQRGFKITCQNKNPSSSKYEVLCTSRPAKVVSERRGHHSAAQLISIPGRSSWARRGCRGDRARTP